jgi:hypothetical protein
VRRDQDEEDVSSSISDEDLAVLRGPNSKDYVKLMMKPVKGLIQLTQTDSGGDQEDIEDSN